MAIAPQLMYANRFVRSVGGDYCEVQLFAFENDPDWSTGGRERETAASEREGKQVSE